MVCATTIIMFTKKCIFKNSIFIKQLANQHSFVRLKLNIYWTLLQTDYQGSKNNNYYSEQPFDKQWLCSLSILLIT